MKQNRSPAPRPHAPRGLPGAPEPLRPRRAPGPKRRCVGNGWIVVSATNFTRNSRHAIESSAHAAKTVRRVRGASPQQRLRFLSGFSSRGCPPTEDGLMDEAWGVDWVNECLWHGETMVRLPPKIFAVLRL